MGFHCNYQQRIGLSHYAFTILENDCTLFHCVDRQSGRPRRHAFVNRIFCNGFDRFDASIEMRLTERREYYYSLNAKKLSAEMEKFVNSVLENERKRLEEKVKGLLSPECVKNSVVSLNTEVLQILEVSREDTFYRKGPAKYLRAVMEEYAALDFLAREQIYYRKEIEQLETYAQNGAVVEIKLRERSTPRQIMPVLIQPDVYRTHLYLAGISHPANEEEKPVSYRFDNIESIQYVHSGALPPRTLLQLKKDIEQNGIQYLSGRRSLIRIRLSPRGIQNYQRYTYQRPSCSSIEGEEKNIYVFDIPEYQAQVYFFKFGADAVVLEPESLRQKFHELYEGALSEYHRS